MHRAPLILLPVAAFVAIVIAIAPASLAGVALAGLSDGTVVLAEAEGTFWHGRGTLTVARAARVPVAWSIAPWPLLRRELQLHLFAPSAAASSPRAEITARRDAVSMREVDVTLPARMAESLAPRSGIRLNGDVHVTAPSLDWTPVAFTGSARIEWQAAQLAIAVDPAIELGTVNATLAATDGRLAGPVTNNGGAFDVRGTVSLGPDGAPNLSLAMTPRAGDSAQARTLMIAVAPDGKWNVEFRMGPP